MNKSTILVIIIGAAIGVALFIYLPKPLSLSTFVDAAKTAGTWIQNNTLQTFALVGGTASTLTAIYNGPYKRLKEAKAIVDEQLDTAQSQMSTVKDSYEATIQQKNDTITELQEQLQGEKQEVAPLLETIRNLKTENQNKDRTIATLNQTLQTQESPSEAEMKRRLEQKNWIVKPKTA